MGLGGTMKRAIVMASLGMVGLLVVAIIYGKSTPHYSLYLLKKAVDSGNPDEALKYIDTDSIAENLARDFLGKDRAGGNQEGTRGPSLRNLMMDALPGIKDSLRASLRTTIASQGRDKENTALFPGGPAKEGGQHSGRTDRKDRGRGKFFLLPGKNQGFSAGGIQIGAIDIERLRQISLWDLTVETHGTTATVSIKETPHIKAKMLHTEAGYWQITEIIISSQ